MLIHLLSDYCQYILRIETATRASIHWKEKWPKYFCFLLNITVPSQKRNSGNFNILFQGIVSRTTKKLCLFFSP